MAVRHTGGMQLAEPFALTEWIPELAEGAGCVSNPTLAIRSGGEAGDARTYEGGVHGSVLIVCPHRRG